MTNHDDSVFTICVTASRHFSSGSEPIQRLCKRCFATATYLTSRKQLHLHSSTGIGQFSMGNHRALERAPTIVEIPAMEFELRFGFLGLARTKPRVLLQLNAVFPSCG
jgi:hypothetical protein